MNVSGPKGIKHHGNEVKDTVQGKISIRSQIGPKSIHVSTGSLFSLRKKRTNKGGKENGVGKDRRNDKLKGREVDSE